MKPTSIKILLILSIASFGYFGLSISSFSPIEPEAGYLISKVCNTLFALGFIILLGVFIKKYREISFGCGTLFIISAYISWYVISLIYPSMNLVLTLPYKWW
ncbi:hypothetical protein KR932_15625 [Acinetobacter baumannii]|uniref:Uncharacterized protein n=2 Tax=Acinetobacter baumannii TaxID=470 RepID=A0ABD5DDG4_ACIBA|nr:MULTISPECIES: hypothetical protein [Acinetobacter calcoaceticus/baumannii complex]AOX79415.1 hypothetical protein KAB03_03856 [Acinetobacter baumannii]AVN12632.1 hypothetical protein C6N18_00060 [Acinetobacter baumannii]EKU1747095.1 hypothetical protein [Acinetobacter baumannii]EKV2371567.1 hypothetical protein [Acinetobacter baumannii]KHZ14178.1 hypothetical protein RQ16_14305 [Acinetobacter baumannii]